MADKKKTKHEFIREAIKEAVARMKPELHAASEAAHHLFEEAEAEDQAILNALWSLAMWSTDWPTSADRT